MGDGLKKKSFYQREIFSDEMIRLEWQRDMTRKLFVNNDLKKNSRRFELWCAFMKSIIQVETEMPTLITSQWRNIIEEWNYSLKYRTNCSPDPSFEKWNKHIEVR